MLQGETYLAAIFKNGNGTMQGHAPHYNMNKIYFLQFFRTTLTGKQIIASPLNEDHRATYHKGEVSIP